MRDLCRTKKKNTRIRPRLIKRGRRVWSFGDFFSVFYFIYFFALHFFNPSPPNFAYPTRDTSRTSRGANGSAAGKTSSPERDQGNFQNSSSSSLIYAYIECTDTRGKSITLPIQRFQSTDRKRTRHSFKLFLSHNLRPILGADLRPNYPRTLCCSYFPTMTILVRFGWFYLEIPPNPFISVSTFNVLHLVKLSNITALIFRVSFMK